MTSAVTATTVMVDTSDPDEGIVGMERRVRALGPVMQSLVKPLRDDQKNHKREKVGPDQPWAPRSAATAAAHHKKRASSLLGKLPSAVQYRADAHAITATSLVAWSAAHRDGDTVGHGAKLPVRESLWISDEMAELAEKNILDSVAKAYGGHS